MRLFQVSSVAHRARQQRPSTLVAMIRRNNIVLLTGKGMTAFFSSTCTLSLSCYGHCDHHTQQRKCSLMLHCEVISPRAYQEHNSFVELGNVMSDLALHASA